MGRWRRTTACERAIRWISLALDGEIGELEGAGLARHLDRCDACAALHAEMGAFTTLLRSSPPVARAPLAVGELPLASRRRRKRRIASAGALAAAVAVFGAVYALPFSGSDAEATFVFQTRQQQIDYVHAENARVETAVLASGIAAPQLRPPPLL